MTRLCFRLSFSFIAVSLITLSGLAQQPPLVAQTASSTAAQEEPSVQGKEAPVTQQNQAVAAAPSQSPTSKEKNSVISQPEHRVNLHPPEILAVGGYSHFMGLAVLPCPCGWGLGYGSLWGPYSAWWSDTWWYPYGYYGGYGPA